MTNFFVTYYSVGYLIAAVTAMVIGVGLAFFRRKSRSCIVLSIIYIVMAFVMLASFVSSSYLYPEAAYIKAISIIGVFLLGGFGVFIYLFPDDIYPVERKYFTGISFVVITASVILYLIKNSSSDIVFNIQTHTYLFSDNAERLNVVSLIVLLLVLYIFSLLIRKYSYYKKLSKESDGVKRQLKGIFYMILLSLVFIVVSFVYFISVWQLSSLVVFELLASSVFSILLMLCTVVYINYSNQPSSLLFKICVISLSAVLSVISLFGYTLNLRVSENYEEKIESLKANATHAVLTDSILIPESIAYIVYREVGKGAYLPDFKPYYSTGEIVVSLINEDELEKRFTFISKEAAVIAKKLSISAYEAEKEAVNILSETSPSLNSSYRVLSKGESDFLVYRTKSFILNGNIYEVGFPYSAYRLMLHESLEHFIYMSLAIAALILILFPLFFSSAVFKPMSSLLKANAKANRGDYSVKLKYPVFDEFGILSAGFNRLMENTKKHIETIEESKKKIKAYNENLEALVEKRTKELLSTGEKYREESIQRRDAEAMLEKIMNFQALNLANASEALLGYGLTSREEQIILDLIKGLSNKSIASKYDIAEPTAKVHTANIYKKLGVNSRIELIKKVLAAI